MPRHDRIARLISWAALAACTAGFAQAQNAPDPGSGAQANLIPELARHNTQLKEQNAKLEAGLEALQARVSRLEGTQTVEVSKPETPGSAPATETAAATAPAEDPPPAEVHPVDLQAHDALGISGLRFRGFATGEFEASNAKGSKGSFQPAAFSLLMMDLLSERWRAIAEINFEATAKFETVVGVERLQLNYYANENFNLSFGRIPSDLSYFNTAFHHGRWLETATDRPRIVNFPADGGLLPLHKTGVAANGVVPHSGVLGLHYFAEFGANPDYGNSANAVAAGLFVKPQALEGWQTGISYQHARMSLANIPNRIDENIAGTHLVFRNSKWEFLNEGFLVSHEVLGLRTYNTTGFYSLLSHEFNKARPFVLYQYINANDAEPLFVGVNRENGPSVGLRYDLTDHADFKAEYFRLYHRHDEPTNKISMHVDWVF